MSKALKTVAIVVGVAALAVTGVGLVIGPAAAAAAGSFFGIASVATVASALSLTASVLGLVSGILTKKPKLGGTGSQLDWMADPAAGEPYVVGDAMVGMAIVHEASWGSKNKYLGIVGALSCAGPIHAYDGFYADMNEVTFSGRNAVGYYNDFMFLSTQLGARPEAAKLDMTAPDASNMPDWPSTAKLSSIAAAGLVLVADVEDGKIYSGGTPKMTHRIRGVLAYDARLDSTQPSGSGAQRALDEDTYAYSANPWVHAETFALGRWVNDVRVLGPGLPAASIDFASYMEAATIADANGWKCSGRILSTDRKWDVLKAMAQAGGGYPMPTGARLSCLVNAPKVSIETITEADLKGPISAPQMAMRRQRINGAIPRYRSADHGWEIVPADAVRNPDYLTADGGNERTREVEFALVADLGDGAGLDQAAQLAAYEVANSREKFPISLELSFYWSQYKCGDCLTLDLPSANIINQKAVVIGRMINPASNTITLQFRTETDAKHTWALGVAGDPPPPVTVATPPGTGDLGNYVTNDEIAAALRATYPQGLSLSASDTGGGTAKIDLSAFTMRYPNGNVAIAAASVTGLNNSTTYYPFADVDDVGDATPAFGATNVYADALNSATHPNRIFLNQSITTPAGGGGPSGGGGFGGGYGGGGAIP